MNNPVISVILPVFNNYKTITEIYNQVMVEILKADLSCEIIFVNDASTDKSFEEINKLQNDYKNIVLLNNEHNIGQQKSIIKGLLNSNGKYCVVMDADLQDSPKHIIPLIESLKPPFEAIFTKRLGSYQSNERMFTSFIFKSITQKLSGLSKNAGTYFVIKSDLIPSLERLDCKFPYVTYMIACLLPNKISYQDAIREKAHFEISQYSRLKRVKAGVLGIACILECKLKILTGFVNS